MMKTVFIIGCFKSIGSATVEKFISSGWCVSFMDSNIHDAEVLKNKIHTKLC